MTDSHQGTADPDPQPGQRHRFRTAGAPSMTPAPKSASSRSVASATPRHAEDLSYLDRFPTSGSIPALENEGSWSEHGSTSEQPSDAEVVQATGSMAVATLLSRITGFLRTVLIASALGGEIASAFNTANTLPNLITELVLGAVLTSLVIPLLVRAEKEDPDRGAAFIRRLFTLTFSLMLAVTVLAVLAAPLLTRMSLDSDGKVNVGMSTAFAYLVLPQIVFYALFSVMMAVLNTKGYFKPGAWAPVANNVVTIAILGLYYLLPQDSKLSPTDSVTITDPHIMLLGLGTTAGVVIQALIMVPFLRKAGIDLRPLWGLDDRLKKFGGMALAIVVYVLISQVGWILNNRIASADGNAPMIYFQAWQLLQMPYGIIGVTLLTAFMPRLSRNAADGDDKAVVKDLSMASRLTMLAMVPVIIYLTAFGSIIGPALFSYGAYSAEAANILGWTISFSAFTLIPYALVLLHLRVFYAREEVWTPTFIIAGITITKLVLAYLAPHVASEPRLVVVLLGAANGMGFVAGAIIGHRLLKRSLGSLGMRSVARTAGWALGASLVAALIAWRVDVLLTHFVVSDSSSLGFIVRLLITGSVFLVLAGVILSFSKLPEVLTVGAMLSRVPGIGRLFRKAAVAAENLEDAEGAVTPSATKITALALGDTGAGMEDTGMVGVLPPLSAGRVRGPRLVPGAPILGGRFRLLASHGGSPAARLWQARDNADGDLVALTVIDTLKSGRTAREIVDATARLADVTANSPAVALVREICNAGSVVVVVSDWTEGAPLTRAAEAGPDPLAAGYAMVDLATAAGAGCTLGIDHRNRLRISTEGRAVLAFPGVIPSGSGTAAGPADTHAIGVSLALLLSALPESEVPASLREIVDAARAGGISDGLELARLLRRATHPEDEAHSSPHLRATADVAPEVSEQTGFGAAPENRGKMTVLGVSTVVGVIAVVAIIALVLAVVGGNRKDSPLTTDSILGGTDLGTVSVVQPSGVVEWAPAGGRGTPDNPDAAGLIADGNPATFWASAQYQVQFGPAPHAVKDGIGLLLTLPDSRALTEVVLTGVRPGMAVELRSASGDVTSLDQTTLIASGTAEGDTLTLGPDSAPADGEEGNSHLPEPGDRVLLWITALPMPEAATVAEVTVHGAPVVKGEGAESASETPRAMAYFPGEVVNA